MTSRARSRHQNRAAAACGPAILNVHAVLTCFNRRRETQRCLEALFGQQLPPGYALHAHVVDDGSTDGTSAMLETVFPRVQVVQGDGNLYWCGGMRLAWCAAALSDPDYYLLLNDDTFLDSHGLGVLLATAGAPERRRIVAGAVKDAVTGSVTYGGVRHPSGVFTPRGEVERCDTFNGNVVLIPRAVYEEMGVFHERYTHGMGDYDYGFQAARAGIEVVQTPCFVGTCRRNSMAGSWLDRSLPRRQRLRLLSGPKGLPFREWVTYNRRNAGWRWPLRACSPWLRVLLGL